MPVRTPRDPSWISLAAAQCALLVWLVALVGADALGPRAPEWVARAAAPSAAASMGALGFAVPAVLGMFPRLAPGLLGFPRPPRALALSASAVGAAMAASGPLWLATGSIAWIGAQGALAALGALLLLITVVRGRAARVSDLKVAAPSARIALPANMMLGAALAYLLVGAASLALVGFAPSALAAFGAAPGLAWPLHLITAGFIALAVFGIGSRMFGAFTGTEAPPLALWAIAGAGMAAPAGIAAGLARSDYGLVALFGTLGLVAAAGFAALVLWMGLRTPKRRRPAFYLLAAGALSLVAGESLGALMGARPELLGLAALHGQTNVLGFAGLTIFGVLFFLSGSDAARADFVAPGIWIAAFWPAALALRAIGAMGGGGAVTLIGDVALVGTYLVAARASHPRRRAPRTPPQDPV